MSDEVVQPTPSEQKFILEKEVTLPISGEKIVLHKLKAGKHYEAQKIYVAWLEDLSRVFDANKINLNNSLGEDGKVDPEKVKDNLNKEGGGKRISDTLNIASSAMDKKYTLLAICSQIPREKLEEDYYPEDLDVLLNESLEINSFLENLKKSAALTVGRAM
jgi:hypothetical protein